MTPRQLMALATMHQEMTDAGTPNRSNGRPAKAESNQGSAGWLMMAASQLNQGRVGS